MPLCSGESPHRIASPLWSTEKERQGVRSRVRRLLPLFRMSRYVFAQCSSVATVASRRIQGRPPHATRAWGIVVRRDGLPSPDTIAGVGPSGVATLTVT